jgi:hypothetical protein
VKVTGTANSQVGLRFGLAATGIGRGGSGLALLLFDPSGVFSEEAEKLGRHLEILSGAITLNVEAMIADRDLCHFALLQENCRPIVQAFARFLRSQFDRSN